MSARALCVLALVAALAVSAAWYVRRPATQAQPKADHALFLPGLADRLPEVTGVTVRVGGGRRLVRLQRDGKTWRVVNRHGYPADPATLRGTLVALAEARRLEAKTDRSGAWSRLGLAAIDQPDADGVELVLEGIEPPLRILIGHRAAADAAGTYARRVADGERAWLVSGTIKRPDEIGDWLDACLVDIAAHELQQVEIDSRDGQPVRVARSTAQPTQFVLANRPPGRQLLSPSIARSIARIVTDLQLSDVHPAAATDTPPLLARARFETSDGLRLVIEALADKREADPRYIRVHAETATAATDKVRQRAERLNRRFDGWLYEIPHYKFVNLTQTLEGVLEPAR